MFIWLLSHFLMASQCAPQLDDCSYYKCRESLQSCGASGYFQRFATPNCDGLTNQIRPLLMDEGQVWMDEAALCLRQELETQSLQKSCTATEDFAFRSHVKCYVQEGFCELSMIDKFTVYSHVRHAIDKDARLLTVMEDIQDTCVARN